MAEQDVSQTSTALAEHRPPAPAAPAPAPSVPGMMSPDEIQQRFRVAAALHQSGLYKDVGSAEQAFAKLVVGRSLGLNEAQSLSLYAMEGKIEVPATMMAGWVRRYGYDYEVEWREENEDGTKVWVEEMSGDAVIDACRVTILVGEKRKSATFSLADAEKAGLVKPKSGWDKFPRNMFYARAMSNAVRWYAPECLAGLPVYTEGEIERVPNLAEGTGSGDEPGWGTVPIAAVHEIEKLIRKAEKLGHAGLASRTAAQMLLNGQSDDVVRKWITDAARELDDLAAKTQVERGETPAPEPLVTVSDFAEIPGVLSVRDCDPAEGHVTLVVAEGTTLDVRDIEQRAPVNLEVHVVTETTQSDADPGLEPDGSTSWREENAHLEPAVQLELAEAKLAGARNEREEAAARAEVERLRGEG